MIDTPALLATESILPASESEGPSLPTSSADLEYRPYRQSRASIAAVVLVLCEVFEHPGKVAHT
jgi:hypothetical protein